ncbi:actin-binding protein wsp1-like [Phragmites australis]|uniref:actin-binding protein wsp1-like n=1 Tax=Phragmites australis TaxID=29695 RepID=UPI002D772F4F|nr:actin-binding protein wsp1-like [Phragmites australis]
MPRPGGRCLPTPVRPPRGPSPKPPLPRDLRAGLLQGLPLSLQSAPFVVMDGARRGKAGDKNATSRSELRSLRGQSGGLCLPLRHFPHHGRLQPPDHLPGALKHDRERVGRLAGCWVPRGPPLGGSGPQKFAAQSSAPRSARSGQTQTAPAAPARPLLAARRGTTFELLAPPPRSPLSRSPSPTPPPRWAAPAPPLCSATPVPPP